MEITLTNKEVLVRVLKDSPIRGLIYIPRTARTSLQLGVVVKNNTDLPLLEGDVIGFKNYTGRPFSLDSLEDPLWLLKEEDVEVLVIP